MRAGCDPERRGIDPTPRFGGIRAASECVKV